MTALWCRVRAEWRAHWRSWTLIVVVIGVIGGGVLAAACGARRTDTAYARFLLASDSSDLLVSAEGTGRESFYRALAEQPGVRSLGAVEVLDAGIVTSSGESDVTVSVFAPTDDMFALQIDRPKVLSGRMFDPDRADEAVIDQAMARRHHLRLGNRISVMVFDGSGDEPDPSHALRLEPRVVGIVVSRTSVVPVTLFDARPSMVLSPAALSEVPAEWLGTDAAVVRLQPGTSTGEFGALAQTLASRYPETRGHLFVADEASQVATVERAIRPQAIALLVFAILAAIAAWLLVGQILSRQLFVASTEHPILRSLGMSPSQLIRLGLFEVGLAATAGGLLSVGVAIVASRFMPIGPARLIEPRPGVEINVAVLAIGFVLIVVLLIARAALPAWRVASLPSGIEGTVEVPGSQRHSRVVALATRWGLPTTGVVGLRMTFEPGRGRTALPVRSALAGTVAAVAALAAALSFGTSLVHLVRSPALYGQTWDLSVDVQFSTIATDQADAFLRTQQGVAGWSYGVHGDVAVAGTLVPAIGIGPGKGSLIFPTLLDGRPPEGPGEIVLGTKTLTRLGGRLQETIPVEINGEHSEKLIVGRGLFPAFGRGSFTMTNLGEGAALAPEVLTQPDASAPGNMYNLVLVRFAPGPQREHRLAALLDNLDKSGYCPPEFCIITTDQRPTDIVNYARVQVIPFVLAGLLLALAVATVAQLLHTSIRRRRRDLAILKTLGFVRAQVSAAVAWQASALAAVALLLGLPIGITLGRWAWALFAGRAGVSAEPHLPVAAALVAIPSALLIANAIAAAPARRASQLQAAPALRTQ